MRGRYAARALGLVMQKEYRKPARRIAPHAMPAKACLPRERQEAFRCVFVRIFRVYGLAGGECEGTPGDMHILLAPALEMHLDARTLAVVKSAVCKSAQVEIGAKLAIHAC